MYILLLLLYFSFYFSYFVWNLTTDYPIIYLCLVSSLCRIYNLSAQDIKFKWEAFSLNLGTDVVIPTIELIRQLKTNLQREFEQNLQQGGADHQPQQQSDQKVKSNNMGFDLSEYTMDTDDGDVLENLYLSTLISFIYV